MNIEFRFKWHTKFINKMPTTCRPKRKSFRPVEINAKKVFHSFSNFIVSSTATQEPKVCIYFNGNHNRITKLTKNRSVSYGESAQCKLHNVNNHHIWSNKKRTSIRRQENETERLLRTKWGQCVRGNRSLFVKTFYTTFYCFVVGNKVNMRINTKRTANSEVGTK